MSTHEDHDTTVDRNQQGLDKTCDPRQPLTQKQRRMGMERVQDPAASERKLAVRAGYSDWTARTPVKNGLDSRQFASRLHEDGDLDLTPTQAKRIGLKVLASLAEDPEQPPGARGAAAKVLLDHGVNSDEFEDNQSLAALGRLSLDLRTRQALTVGLRMALRRPRSKVLVLIELLQAERQEIRLRLNHMHRGT